MEPKVNILFKFMEGPWGGGNQFLKALKEYFIRKGNYVDDPAGADVIIFNSYPFGNEESFKVVRDLKRKYPEKILIHRVDGPISFIRGADRVIDRLIFMFNELFADGTVFQSVWSKDNNVLIGMKRSPYETTIINAPDPLIFNSEGKKPYNKDKIRLIATSWSSNPKKGFDVYGYLDDNLDAGRYEMSFVGNSPREFRNIKWIKPVPSKEVARILKEHDIFITASRSDPCSNSLIEALHCGLPAVAIRDGGHPELIGKGGELFDDGNILEAIEKVADNYQEYVSNINMPSMEDIGERYHSFACRIYEDRNKGRYAPKNVGMLTAVKYAFMRTLMAIKKYIR